MADLLVAAGIVVFVAAMLGLAWALERVIISHALQPAIGPVLAGASLPESAPETRWVPTGS